MRTALGVLVAVVAIAVTGSAVAESPAGAIKVVTGAAFVVRQGAAIPAQVNDSVLVGDALRTGSDGSIGVLLADDTLLSLGPNAELVIDEFLFAPAQGQMGFVARLLRGAFAYVSGIIAKLSPGSVRIETPVATVGIRGTRILSSVDGAR
jgi:hypothetical protein